MPEKRDTPRVPTVGRVRRKWLLFAVAGVVVLVVLVLLAVLLTGREDADSGLASDQGDAGETLVTSPYDFFELPVGSEPQDVEDASYVSILLVSESGQLTSYGLSSEMPEAQALKAAVHEAEEADEEVLSSLTTTPRAVSDGENGLGSTLTFMFPDRTTLTFDLYVDQGLIARDDRVWRVEGDLSLLVEAAATAGPQ
jgi:hypothetical protein